MLRRTALALSMAVAATLALAQDLIDGQLMKVDMSAAKLTIKHGPIPKLDMDEGMTMVFAVQDRAMLTVAKAGDRIKFDAERVNGQLTVTKIQKTR